MMILRSQLSRDRGPRFSGGTSHLCRCARRVAIGCLAAGLSVGCCLAGALPAFEDFQRADQERRLTGQPETAESLGITRVSPELIRHAVQEKTGDPQVLWGAAELLRDWGQKRAMFELALSAGGTNDAVAVRFACAAAQQGEHLVARQWFRYEQQHDPSNAVPWLAECWIRHQLHEPLDSVRPLPVAGQFRDYAAAAARARIALLEAAGYSKFSARRLGFDVDQQVLSMLRDLARQPTDQRLDPLLMAAARAMQRQPTFLLTELVGQSVERAVLTGRPGAGANEEVEARLDELAERRRKLQRLIAETGRDAVPLAIESEMVQYFDDLLAVGEEAALRRLAELMRRLPDKPPKPLTPK